MDGWSDGWVHAYMEKCTDELKRDVAVLATALLQTLLGHSRFLHQGQNCKMNARMNFGLLCAQSREIKYLATRALLTLLAVVSLGKLWRETCTNRDSKFTYAHAMLPCVHACNPGN